MNTSTPIRTHVKTCCYLCGSTGKPLYKELSDRLFGVTGSWNLDICSNPEFNLAWLNPMPDTEELSKLYENYYTHHYEQKNHHASVIMSKVRHACYTYYKNNYDYLVTTSTFMDKILAFLISCHPEWKANLNGDIFYLPYTKDGKLLDVGCGNGETLKKMGYLGWNAIGIDFDTNSVKIAQSRGLDARHGDLEQQDFRLGQFDAIIMSHVIEHLPDPIKTMAHCFELLKSGGIMVITTPNISGYTGRIYKQNARHLEPPRHLHLFQIQSLRKLAQQAGFNKIEVTTSIRHFRGMWMESCKLKHNRLSTTQKIISLLLSVVFGLALKLKIGEGDELVLKAFK